MQALNEKTFCSNPLSYHYLGGSAPPPFGISYRLPRPGLCRWLNMRAVPRTSSSTKTSLGEGHGIHVAHLRYAIHDEEVPQAKTTPTEEAIL